jgi:hypothetical protein
LDPVTVRWSRASLELGAMLLTGAAHLFFESILNAKAIFIPVAGFLWAVYFFRRVRKDPGVLRKWGFRSDNLLQAFRVVGGVSILAAVAVGLLAFYLGNSLWTPSLLWMFLLYPVWGLVQQFLLQALVARNVAELTGSGIAATGITAVLFGTVHAPDWVLCGLTFALALFFVPLYFRIRNLYPLGLFHGWLGAMVYIGILGRDPWTEVLGACENIIASFSCLIGGP